MDRPGSKFPPQPAIGGTAPSAKGAQHPDSSLATWRKVFAPDIEVDRTIANRCILIEASHFYPDSIEHENR